MGMEQEFEDRQISDDKWQLKTYERPFGLKYVGMCILGDYFSYDKLKSNGPKNYQSSPDC